MKNTKLCYVSLFAVFWAFTFLVVTNAEVDKEEVDKVIEDEITQKLSVDLLQSIERKFQVDLEKSVDQVLSKIKLLLQNGTEQIQDKLADLQNDLDNIRSLAGNEQVDECLAEKQTHTQMLAEKALHQMVVCGYALIGHDPAQAVKNVIEMKNMIKQGLKPVQAHKDEIYNLLKVCGHDHDSLKKVIKCVMSKSPVLKAAMMDVTGKMIEGVVHLTKLMAHGAMHEACLIEVIKTVEDEAKIFLKVIKACSIGGNVTEAELYLKENNATVLDVKKPTVAESNDSEENHNSVSEMKTLMRRMLSESNPQKLDKKFKDRFLKLKNDLGDIDTNAIANEVLNKDD